MRKKAKRRTRWNSTFAQPSDATLKKKRVIAKRNSISRSLRQNKQGRKPIKKKPRKASETLRIYGPPARRAWIKAQRSVASGKGPCEQAHVIGGGVGRKADARFIVPLTRHEHRGELHQHGKEWFEKKYGISLDFMAAQTEQAWQAHLQARKSA